MQDSLSKLVRVIHGDGDFSSKLVSLVDVEPDAVLTKIEGSTNTSRRAYTSVQTGEDTDIELNSDLVYCNHSCDPSVIFDMERFEVRTVPTRGLKKGDDLTFFYPSTEWQMRQPFRCHCGSDACVGFVSGAKDLDEALLRQYWLNPHIERLLAERVTTEPKLT